MELWDHSASFRVNQTFLVLGTNPSLAVELISVSVRAHLVEFRHSSFVASSTIRSSPLCFGSAGAFPAQVGSHSTSEKKKHVHVSINKHCCPLFLFLGIAVQIPFPQAIGNGTVFVCLFVSLTHSHWRWFSLSHLLELSPFVDHSY